MRHDKRFINLILVCRVECSSMQRDTARRTTHDTKRSSGTSSRSRGKQERAGGASFHLFLRRPTRRSRMTLRRERSTDFFTRGHVRPVEGFTADRHKGEC